MADTRRLRVLKAIEAALNADPGKPADLIVHRLTFRTIENDKLPSVVVYDAGQAEPSDRGGTLVENTMDVALALQIKGNQAEPPDDVADPYLSWLTRALMEDPATLDGAATLVKMGRREPTESVQTDRVYVRIVQHVTVTMHHRRDNPELDS